MFHMWVNEEVFVRDYRFPQFAATICSSVWGSELLATFVLLVTSNGLQPSDGLQPTSSLRYLR